MGGSCACGAHQIQCVAFDMGGILNMHHCVMLEQSRGDRNSEAKGQLVESTWMLKSPSRSVDVDIEQMEVSSSDSSDRKVEEAFGGS